MKRRPHVVIPALLLALALAEARADQDQGSPAIDPEKLQEVLQDRHARLSDLWIYNDLSKAFAAAKRTGKPLFVTFRCVPCKACSGFDAEVAEGRDAIARLARERFVSVRQVEMKGVDLTQFQFDYDLNWAAMFLNADGTVYARYGTQSALGHDAYNSIEGLEHTMRRVLDLHAAYPKNRAELVAKRGARKPWAHALQMPWLREKKKLAGATTRQNCVHCHNLHDAEHHAARDNGTFSSELLWRYPLPDNIGLRLDPRDGRTIKSIENASPAERAGLFVGEQITHVEGQAIASIADVQWALHGLESGDTKILVRGSRSGEQQVSVEKGWKRTDISWRGSIWSVSPRLRVWAPALSREDRLKRGLSEKDGALLVRWINRAQKGGRAVYESGLRQGDVIVELDGKPFSFENNEFMTHVKLHYKVGDRLPLTVLRQGKRVRLALELVE